MHQNKVMMLCTPDPTYVKKVKYPLCNLLHSSRTQELFKKHLCNQSSHYEIYFYTKGGRHMLPPNQHFCCQQRLMEHKNTKEDTS